MPVFLPQRPEIGQALPFLPKSLTFSGQTKLNRYLAQHRALSNGSSGKRAES